MNETKIFDASEIDDSLIIKTLKEVMATLEERGYNPVNQIVGYLMSGDPGYISNYKQARNNLTKIDRAQILKVLLKEFNK